MKKFVLSLFAFCVLCGSAFADVTITDWGIFADYYTVPIVYDGLIADMAPAGFSVAANSEMWGDTGGPWAAFQSNTISPGWIMDHETTSFAVSINGFDDLFIKEGNPIHSHDTMYVRISNAADIASAEHNSMIYKIAWKGDGLYEFGRGQFDAGSLWNSFEAANIYIWLTTNSDTVNDSIVYYYLGDNTQGTIEITASEVPEPSSLLALAFGGAGTMTLAFRKRK